MIAIIAAMEKELKTILDAMDISEIVTISDKILYIGMMKNKEVIVAKSGIGKVNAAITTTILCLNYEIDFIINTGVAGGLFPVNTGEIVLSEAVTYFDVNVINIDPELSFGQIPGDSFLVKADEKLVSFAKSIFDDMKFDYRIGIIASGDQFITDSQTLKPIQKIVENLLAVEMESMAVAVAASKFNIPFIIIRGISDVIDDTLQVQIYENSVDDIAGMTAHFVIRFVEEYHWTR